MAVYLYLLFYCQEIEPHSEEEETKADSNRELNPETTEVFPSQIYSKSFSTTSSEDQGQKIPTKPFFILLYN